MTESPEVNVTMQAATRFFPSPELPVRLAIARRSMSYGRTPTTPGFRKDETTPRWCCSKSCQPTSSTGIDRGWRG
jgi:hypothetical protein